MARRRTWLVALAFGVAGTLPAAAQTTHNTVSRPGADPGRPDAAVMQALQSSPVTAPYRISANWRDGKLVLAGRVGTKQIHDAAVRTALAYTSAVRDDLVIDTAEAHRAAAQTAAGPAYPVAGSAARAIPSLGTMPYALGSLPYVYPQPLFGRLDDPFFGFEPPLVSYPPWWGAVAAREAMNLPAPGGAMAPNAAPAPAAAGPATSVPLGPSPGDGTVEMTIDSRGVATLRGTVNNLAERIAVGQQIAQTPGVSEVINLLQVRNSGAGPKGVSATPPPPPQPAFIPAVKPRAAIAADARPAVAVDAGNLTPRLTDAFTRRPALVNLPIQVSVHDGIANLSGQVPTVYEAMLAFRAVQQTPGVDQVIDRLQFTVPNDETKNPLLSKGRPEDVEPYLMAQLRRQLGDLAHVDQVRVRADTLEVRGTLAQADDRPRLDAILRSMAILRGFRLVPEFMTE
ncbi:MAG: BON domain-containing protein [Isosphaeraceae bacterium]|nr:BON domain-containing protein [Isosphaeraceae bacterium]